MDEHQLYLQDANHFDNLAMEQAALEEHVAQFLSHLAQLSSSTPGQKTVAKKTHALDTNTSAVTRGNGPDSNPTADHLMALAQKDLGSIQADLNRINQELGPFQQPNLTRNVLKDLQKALATAKQGLLGHRPVAPSPLAKKAFKNLDDHIKFVTNQLQQVAEGGLNLSCRDDKASPLTITQLRGIMPTLSANKAQKYLPLLNAAMKEYGITTRGRETAFLAQIAHESAQLTQFDEKMSVYKSSQGTYHGRGPIQLTGKANYAAAGAALGQDFVRHPELASDPKNAFRVAGWYWKTHGLNKLADQGDFDGITRRINGGTLGETAREGFYFRALRAIPCSDHPTPNPAPSTPAGKSDYVCSEYGTFYFRLSDNIGWRANPYPTCPPDV